MLLRIENITKYYGNKTQKTLALKNVNFCVEEGELLGIMGTSGSGKTTLLNCISTIDTVSKGKIFLNEREITGIPEKELAAFRGGCLGFVFQDSNLLDTLTIEENIALPLVISGISPKETKNKTAAIASELGITEVLEKFPYEVSGGQKQRGATARAMVTNPRLILADEPTGALDSQSSEMLMRMFRRLNRRFGATILMVTHDPCSASYADRVLFLQDGAVSEEISRDGKNKKEFYHEILTVLSRFGGDQYLC